jgi:CheY-like chemotaxis protein
MKKTVLVVDDDASVRKSLSKVLRGAGYEVVLARDGQEAVERFDPEHTDLLLLDIGLPIKNGWETFERITNEDPALPIIVITGQAGQYDAAVAAGAGALMEKPLDAPQLLETMEELLAEPKEVRLRRLCGYRKDVRHIPSDSALFLQKLRAQAASPFRCTLSHREDED